MKVKILLVGFTIIIFSWVGNFLYFQSKQLEHPIFLDHYYETYIQHETILTFYYLSNKFDHTEVSTILIDGVEVYPVSTGGFSMWTSDTPNYEQEFSHHYLKSVRLELPNQLLPIKEGSDDIWSFEKVTVIFTNGQTLDTDIGKVKVYGKLPGYEDLESSVSSSSNQHRSEETMVAKKPLTVEVIKIPFPEEVSQDVYVKVDTDLKKINDLEARRRDGDLPDWFAKEQNIIWEELDGISINEEGILPFHLNKNGRLQLSMQFNPSRKSYFEFGVEIIGKTDEGAAFMRKSLIIDHPSLTQQAINEIIVEKLGGRDNE